MKKIIENFFIVLVLIFPILSSQFLETTKEAKKTSLDESLFIVENDALESEYIMSSVMRIGYYEGYNNPLLTLWTLLIGVDETTPTPETITNLYMSLYVLKDDSSDKLLDENYNPDENRDHLFNYGNLVATPFCSPIERNKSPEEILKSSNCSIGVEFTFPIEKTYQVKLDITYSDDSTDVFWTNIYNEAWKIGYWPLDSSIDAWVIALSSLIGVLVVAIIIFLFINTRKAKLKLKS